MSLLYPHLFSPLDLPGLRLKNRVVMAPMSTSLGGRDGAVTPANIAFYRERALGGFGLIIVEFTCVDPATGRTEECQLSLESKRNLDGHVRLVDTLHEAGTKAFVQLQHGGRFSPAHLLPSGVTKGPSRVVSRKDPNKVIVQPFDGDEITRLIEAFVRTATLAVQAGYDGIEVHAAHGYLFSQFMSPLSNQREDEWGGDFERRLAFPLAVARGVKQAIGTRPLSFRISADEFIPGGLTIDVNEVIARRLVEAGADIIHASMGRGPEAFDKVMEPMSAAEGWRLPYARRLRAAAGVPVIGVGQIRWPETGEEAIARGDADLIALGRPSLADPEWPNKAAAGRRDAIRPCTTCNWCISNSNGGQVGCAENPRAGSELDAPIPSDLGTGKRAVVVGAGPGGIAAALMLDQAGFETHLYEARSVIGGGLIASATPPGKDKLFWYRDYLGRRLAGSSVAVHLGHRVAAEELLSAPPDVAIIAAGTMRRALPIEGLDDAMVTEAFDVLMGDADASVPKGGRVVVYGGGETGCEAAEFFAHRGVNVVLVTRSPVDKLARSAEAIYRIALLKRLTNNPAVEILDGCHVVRAGHGEVVVEFKDGESRVLRAARLLLAQGRDSQNALAERLVAAGVLCHVVGDSREVGRIGDAVHAAYKAMRALTGHYAGLQRLAC
jgi:2,4-dienoyl-CoA reductase-like NADH-dependent reductase (Old Yellow Enzyme family)/thioredoxin reductase